MKTAAKFSKHLLKLADSIKAKDKDNKIQLTRINIKDNVLYSTDGLFMLRCELNSKDLPVSDLETGYYDIAGNCVIKDNDFSKDWNYPKVENILDNNFDHKFSLPYNNAYISFIFTLCANDILINYQGFDKQLKQLFKHGADFTIYYFSGERVLLLECSYPVCDIADIPSKIQLFMMPMKKDFLPEVKDTDYNVKVVK